MNKAEKLEALKAVGASLDKKFEEESGKTLQRLGNKVNKPIPSLSSNLPSLDYEVLGCGGFPRGRIIEVFGPESSGKTAACLHLIGEVQRSGGLAAFVDAEHSLDPTFASNLGVNVDELLVSQPDYGEQALEIVLALVDSQAVDVIVVDSVTALVPKAELEGDMGDSHMGLQARLMSQAMRKLVGLCSKKGVTVVFINQIREKVGLVFGSPEVTTGGRALKFFASVRLEARRVAGADGEIKGADGKAIGHKVKFKAVKNKVAAPKREAVIKLYYDTGFDTAEDTLEYAKKAGLVKGAAWLTFGNDDQKYRKEDLLSGVNFDKLVKAVKSYRDELTKQLTLEGTDEQN